MNKIWIVCSALLLNICLPALGALDRVVTLIPSLGEIAADILEETAQKQIVGVSDYTKVPSFLAKVPSVGPYVGLNLERVAALEPDLVLATQDGNYKLEVDQIRDLGFKVVVVKSSNLKEIAESFVTIAQALGKPDKGKQMRKRLYQEIADIRKKANAKLSGRRPRVMIQIDVKPLIVAGGTSFLNDALSVLGAENVFGDVQSAYPTVSKEAVLKANPDWIVMLGMDETNEDLPEILEQEKRWKTLKSLRAAAQGPHSGIITVNHGALIRPTAAWPQGVRHLGQSIGCL